MRGDGPQPSLFSDDAASFSPRAWGWSGESGDPGAWGNVLPTCVGMVRSSTISAAASRRSPHVRGDGPIYSAEFGGDQVLPTCVGMVRLIVSLMLLVMKFSPRAWGWSDNPEYYNGSSAVLPTCVGMVRESLQPTNRSKRSPHVRGDGPLFNSDYANLVMFSPRAWGWSEILAVAQVEPEVLPTCVGMVRSSVAPGSAMAGSPHVRGDGPAQMRRGIPAIWFSPRAWGWSVAPALIPDRSIVLPTCVGMVRAGPSVVPRLVGPPHVRGDGPSSTASNSIAPRFSPRAWGWSGRTGTCPDSRLFSPRAWGWSGVAHAICLTSDVLPTCVGMVRARHGEVPSGGELSPRAWGWSAGNRLGARPPCSPHVRGDGPPGS